VLDFGWEPEERLRAILAYSAVQIGLVLWGKYTDEQIEYFRAHPPKWCRSKLKQDLHLQIAMGCKELEIIPPGLRSVWEDYCAFNDFVNDWEEQHGPDPKVRIVIDWVLEAMHGTGMSYDEFSVLSGIYSKIGSKLFVRITREEIWRRSLGYKSELVFKAETGGSGFSRTARQVRDTIERLTERNFFARTTIFECETYYSNRLSQTELEAHVFEAKVYRARARQARITANAELTRKIQAERRKLAGGDATDGATPPPL
jgi:hypothetical protein